MFDRRSPWWRSSIALLLALILGISAACGGDGDDAADLTATPAVSASSEATTSKATDDVPTGLDGDLTVFAAASLTDAFAKIQNLLEDANPDLSITYNFAGSQQLATQLADGAPADVFASANMSQMTAARDADTIEGEPLIFARNRLAIIVPSDNPAGLETPADLAKSGIKLVVADETVPVGGYTLEVLDLFSADAAFGADFRAEVEANFVSLESNVRQVVTKVQLGEADAGIVYVSDVTPDVRENVTIIEIPDQFNVIAQYPVAPVAGGDAELTQAFIAYLLTPNGQAILEEWGFTPLE